MRDDIGFGILRLLHPVFQQHRIDAAVDPLDRAVLYLDAHRFGHVAAQHHQQITDIENQRSVGRLFFRRAIEKPRRPTIPPALLVADPELGQTLAALFSHLEI